jgi:hypothetical protein
MKSLNEFKTIVEEEKSDYSKFDMLVRAGLANKAQLQRIHKILDKMQEERPVFNNADRMILQNLFNKMVDLISNNKQIFQQSRKAVREEVDVIQIDESSEPVKGEPPFTLLLKRKSIRQFANDTYIALYHSDKLKKHFTIPFSKDKDIDSSIQAEETQIEEAVMDQLHKIVADKQAQKVKFGNGKTKMIDGYTASAVTQVHKALNDENKKKFADMVHKSPEHFVKASDFAFKHVK